MLTPDQLSLFLKNPDLKDAIYQWASVSEPYSDLTSSDGYLLNRLKFLLMLAQDQTIQVESEESYEHA